MNYKFKTIIISDVHLGTKDSKIKELIKFLKDNPSMNLIMNGDIIDGWNLKRTGKWRKKDTKFIKYILNLILKDETNIVYLKGNHDSFISNMHLLSNNKLTITDEFIYESFGKKYVITHGDLFDSTNKMIWLSKLGSIGYDLLLWYNRWYNYNRLKKGLPYKSISSYWKENVKIIVNFLSKFENNVIKYAIDKKCDGVICGHVHKECIKNINGIVYMNSGDWVESLTALTEDFHGKWEIYKK
jgi:UDP-2,3-diacylglucosamine pyrophosphatase LpxH